MESERLRLAATDCATLAKTLEEEAKDAAEPEKTALVGGAAAARARGAELLAASTVQRLKEIETQHALTTTTPTIPLDLQDKLNVHVFKRT